MMTMTEIDNNGGGDDADLWRLINVCISHVVPLFIYLPVHIRDLRTVVVNYQELLRRSPLLPFIILSVWP